MIRFERILFPVDFSTQCQAAAKYVAFYARRFDAAISMLHVEGFPVQPYDWEPQTARLTQMLEEFSVRELAGLKVDRMVYSGDPASEIIRLAESEGADLIMMPTHGRGPFRRFVLGSVTAKVLHDTSAPVWTAAHLAANGPDNEPKLESIVCAVDLDDRGLETLRYSADLAAQNRAALTIAHAVPAVETLPDAYMDGQFRADLVQSAREQIAQMQNSAGSSALVCVGAANIAKFVSHAAQTHRADLVVIGRGGNGVLGRLRTHDYAIMRECECPVLSI